MASGDALAYFAPHSGEAGLTLFPQFVVLGSTDTPIDEIALLAFDQTTQEYIVFSTILPGHYSLNGIDVVIVWSTGATSGNCVWSAEFKSFTNDQDSRVTKNFDTAKTITVAAPSAANEILYDTIAFNDGDEMDFIGRGEYFRLRISRDADNAADTINSNSCHLLGVFLKET